VFAVISAWACPPLSEGQVEVACEGEGEGEGEGEREGESEERIMR